MVGTKTFFTLEYACILFKFAAISNDSIRCIIDGRNEKEYNVEMDIGDIMIEQSSGGNSTKLLLGSASKNEIEQSVKFLVMTNTSCFC